MTKEICERCEKVYDAGKYSHYCPKCRKALISQRAKERGLNRLGTEARRKRKDKND